MADPRTIIINNPDLDSLIKEVEKFVESNEGWTPFGEILRDNGEYHQIMVFLETAGISY